MLRAWILRWLFAASVLIVSSAQNTPPIPIAQISLPDPAYVGMPIWMQVDSPTNHTVHYPSSTTPNDFYCNEVDVKQNGRLLSPLKGFPPAGRAGPACGWLGVADNAQSKLPIHLQYPLTQPGTYLVRFTRREHRGTGKLEIAEQSDWVALHLRTAPPGMIESWLSRQLSTLPAGPVHCWETRSRRCWRAATIVYCG